MFRRRNRCPIHDGGVPGKLTFELVVRWSSQEQGCVRDLLLLAAIAEIKGKDYGYLIMVLLLRKKILPNAPHPKILLISHFGGYP